MTLPKEEYVVNAVRDILKKDPNNDIINQFSDKLGWIGRLPGDVRLGSENFRFYFPFTSLIILNLIFYFIMKIFQWLK